MARKNQTIQVSIKIPAGLLKAIDEDIETNQEHASRSDYIVRALEAYERMRTDTLAARKTSSDENNFTTPENDIQDPTNT